MTSCHTSLSTESLHGLVVDFPSVREPRESKMESVFYDLPLEVTFCHYFCILCVRRVINSNYTQGGWGLGSNLQGESIKDSGLILKSPQHGNRASFILWDTIIIQGLGSLADGGWKHRGDTNFLKTLIWKGHILHSFLFQLWVSHGHLRIRGVARKCSLGLGQPLPSDNPLNSSTLPQMLSSSGQKPLSFFVSPIIQIAQDCAEEVFFKYFMNEWTQE